MPLRFPCAGARALWAPTRREFLYSLGASVGSVALSALLAEEGYAAAVHAALTLNSRRSICEIELGDFAGASTDLERVVGIDKGYDYGEFRALAVEFGFTAHIRSRGEEAKAIKKAAGFRARRWVVERAHSWMNRFRDAARKGSHRFARHVRYRPGAGEA